MPQSVIMHMAYSSKYWLASKTISRYGKSWKDNVCRVSSQRLQSTLVPVSDGQKTQAPKILTTEMAVGCQAAMKLFLKYGLGMQRLKEISKNAGQVNTLVQRWQRMMEAFIGTQVHVLAGMGYSPDEAGLGTLFFNRAEEHPGIYYLCFEYIIPSCFFVIIYFSKLQHSFGHVDAKFRPRYSRKDTYSWKRYVERSHGYGIQCLYKRGQVQRTVHCRRKEYHVQSCTTNDRR